MAGLAWIASEVGSATDFSGGRYDIAEELTDQGRECWLDAKRASIHVAQRQAKICSAFTLPCCAPSETH